MKTFSICSFQKGFKNPVELWNNICFNDLSDDAITGPLAYRRFEMFDFSTIIVL
jgi:hypothetical protein